MKIKQLIPCIIVFGVGLLVILYAGQFVTTPDPIRAQEINSAAGTSQAFLPAIVRGPGDFLATFDGDPPHPTPWEPADWDVTVHSRDVSTWDAINTMQAAHGPNCEPPPATHTISAYEDTVYQCKNHLMTAMNAAGYGLIYLTPNHLVDFSQGEAVVSFDVSTLRSSGRDWIDLWITPYEDNLQLTLQDFLPDLSGEPRNSIHIVMDFNTSSFHVYTLRNFVLSEVPGTQSSWVGYEDFLTPDARRRDTFKLYISENHIKFGMPDYNFWWVDTSIAPLGWNQGVVQFGHHSYNPAKFCSGCGPNTWHWDNIRIAPSVPFTILRADRRYVEKGTTATVHFPASAPANSHLRFAGIGNNLQVSFDGGSSWQPVQMQPARFDPADENFKSYWMPVPAGTTSVKFRGEDWWGGGWQVRDISIWSRTVR
ncbi:MAG: hypothetical protein KC441_09035 [Anaerolineales bacterium]|nr:hypothetical protein [Anaerolineales bacterium]